MDAGTAHGGRQALTSLGNLDSAIISPRGGIQDSAHTRKEARVWQGSSHGRKFMFKASVAPVSTATCHLNYHCQRSILDEFVDWC